MKNIKKKLISIMLSVALLFSVMPFNASAQDNDDFSVVVSVEGLTLGQGLYVKPTRYTLSQINNLVAQKGYGPFTEENLPADMATLAMFIDHNYDYNTTGNWTDNIYLSSIKGIDSGVLNIPDFISSQSGAPTNDDNDGNSDDYLGEFDYSMMSGWMYTVDNQLVNVGMSGCKLNNNDVIRLQFTLWGYGADLGLSGFAGPAYFTGVDKTDLYRNYADCNNNDLKATADSAINKLDTTQEEVNSAISILNNPSNVSQDISETLNNTMAQMASNVSEPQFGSIGGEWTVMGLARGEYYDVNNKYFSDYYSRIVDTVNQQASNVASKNGALDKRKSTENSRLILALASIGKNPQKVGDWNLLNPYNDFDWIKMQGINGPIFALLALDSNNYQLSDSTIRQQCIDYILNNQLEDGGWALMGTDSDPDITSMALQALAKYKDNQNVNTAAQKAITTLSNIQKDNGGYASWGSENSESISQVIVACTAWGINPDTDSRFIKNGNSCIDALLSFYLSDEKQFYHSTSSKLANQMSTEQAVYAMVAYNRLINNKNSLYDMSDVEIPTPKDITETISLPANIENVKDTTFNAVINMSSFKNDEGYKLMDAVINIPSQLSVENVTIGNSVNGGELSYNLDTSSGKLRVVYFDSNTNSDMTVTNPDSDFELMTIKLRLNQYIDINSINKLTVSVTGMSLKKNSNPSDENSIKIINTSSADVNMVNGASFSAMELFQGDGVDLIDTNKKAIAVLATGIENQTELTYSNGDTTLTLLYNAAISQKTGVNSYVAMVDSSIDMESFADKDNYIIGSKSGTSMTFGDINNDGYINAQDALSSVNYWLRKSVPDDNDILSANVNADSRLNTFDALGIVENIVNGSEFAVVSKAGTLKNAG